MGENYSVEDTLMESVQDDAALAPDANALSDALDAAQNTEETTAEETEVEQQEGETNKALKGRMKSYEKRGYNRGQREAEARWAEEKRNYEERLAKYQQRDMEDEVKGLVDKGMPKELAEDYVRLKHNQPQKEQPAQQTRDDAGRFAQNSSNEQNAAAQQRAQLLMEQAASFEKMSDGVVSREQILDAFQNDPQIKAAVSSGEMDFIDVGKQLAGNGGSRAPRMVRNTNDGALQSHTIANMSDADFAKLNERVRLGAVFDSRR